MKKFLTTVLLLVLIGIVAGVAASLAARKRLEAMSDEEIRAFLAEKLEGKVGEDQLTTIQDATVAGVRKKLKSPANEVVEADAEGDNVADADADVEVLNT